MLRAAGQVGSGLEAEVDLYLDAAHHRQLGGLGGSGDELRFVLGTSAARLHPLAARPAAAMAAKDFAAECVFVAVQASTAQKCVRCWHRRADVGQHAEHPEICARCVGNVAGAAETRAYA